MFKKIALFIVVVVLLSVNAYGSSQQVYEYRCVNATGNSLQTVVPITTIRPKVDKLVGYRVIPSAKAGQTSEVFCGLFDGTDKTMTGECFGESEAPAATSIGESWPDGKYVFNGVAVQQGALTTVIVYFISR